MLLWALSLFSLLLGLWQVLSPLQLGRRISDFRRERDALRQVTSRIQEMEEQLMAGLVPPQESWDRLHALQAPWGALAYEGLMELRSRGASLLPTLKRLRQLSQEHFAAWIDAQAKSSQALAQGVVCASLVPVFGSFLYLLLPELQRSVGSWAAGCFMALLVSSMGGLWLFQIAESARWAGLKRNTRHWPLAAQCAGERLLALIRSGTPADLAWIQTTEFLSQDAPELARNWGRSIWQDSDERSKTTQKGVRILYDAGDGIRKAIQSSLIDGKPCTERIESALLGLRQEFKAQVERELSLLPTRALKPLFFCLAPALLGLLGFGLWMVWEQTWF